MKINKIVVYFLLSTFFVISCNAQQKRSIDACAISKNIDGYSRLIKSDSIRLIITKSNDNCNLGLIDSLITKFLRGPNRPNFDLLTSVANRSDGYVSEYIVEKMGKVYYTKFDPFFIFLYEDFENKRKNKLENFLVECWSTIAAANDNATTATAKIRKSTQNIVTKQQGDVQSRMKYLNGLLSKINAKYLD
jgi:hypothetical protein